MGGGWNYKRLALLHHKYKNLEHMKAEQHNEEIESAKITQDETICKSCGFKARYKFSRCPICSS